MKTLKERVEVMQAALDGEDIEYRNKSRDASWDIMPSPEFDSWDRGDYRIKPKPREFWVNVYKDDIYVHKSQKRAENFQEGNVKMETIKVIEVLE